MNLCPIQLPIRTVGTSPEQAVSSAAILMDLVPQQTHGRGGNVVAYERAFIVYRLACRNAGVDAREHGCGTFGAQQSAA